jgi:hypothetical protein
MDANRMFNFLANCYHIFKLSPSIKQKNSNSQSLSGFMATETGLYLATTLIIVALTTKLMHDQIVYLHKLFKEQYVNYQKINLIAELQQDLLLPAKILMTNSGSKEGLKIIRNNLMTIDWQFKPNGQRGINGSWTKLYEGQIECKFLKDQLLLEFDN